MKILSVISCLCIILTGCKQQAPHNFQSFTKDSPSIVGKKEYLNSPMVTAGDRVYMVGHQDGSFPELGWHIKGEMGGIWNHPIKLMDGIEIVLTALDTTNPGHLSLDKAHTFTNYPFANKHSYSWPSQNLELERWQFVPDKKEGVVVQLVLKNKGHAKSYRMLFAGHVDLRPTWLGERTKMIDTRDMVDFRVDRKAMIARDSLNPWFTVFGSNLISNDQIAGNGAYQGNGISGGLVYDITLEANETKVIDFVIAGSFSSEANAWENYESIKENIESDLRQKRARYEAIAETSKLTIPNKEIEQAYEWVKYNSDWLVQTVPGVGSGITAGIPDYPWWFGCDSEYALQGYMAVGQRDAVYNTIALLDSVSIALNGNGKIIHEMSTNGAVYNPGNINETPQFASLVWKIYQWNGDKDFLARYFPTIEKGLDWLMTENDADKNNFPDGFGMMEIHGMDSEMIDVAAYTQKAFADAAKMAEVLGETDLAKNYQQKAKLLKDQINEQFWSEEFNSYADFIGTDEQALRLIDDAIVRADTLKKPWAVAELEQTRKAILQNPSSLPRPFVLHHNWVVNTPMEVNLAPKEKAVRALTTAEKFVNPFGVFVTGIDRDESAGSDDGSFKGSKQFSYTGAVMTLPTGVQIIAENNYGRPDKALNYLERMTRSFSYALPGSMYEVSPDYGMIVQAWNIYSYGVPIVEQFFGIKPDAANKKVVIAPQMPSKWKSGSLENVKVGDNEVSIFYSEENGNTKLRVTQSQPDWTLEIRLPKETNKGTMSPTDAENENISSETHFAIRGNGSEVTLELVEND